MKPTRRYVSLLSVVLALVLSACTSDENTTPLTVAGGGFGAQVYQASCASCHGVDLKGTDKGPSQLSIVYEPNHHGDDSYRSAAKNGARQHHWNFGDMPPVAGITDAEIEAVIVYIRSEQERLGFEG